MVRQVRVIRNTLIIGVIFLYVLWMVRKDILDNSDALIYGMLGGGLYASIYWKGLLRRIRRQDNRYEKNKIFVQFISVFEFLLTVAASGHYVLMGLGVVILIVAIFDFMTGHWWMVLASAFGVISSAVLTVLALQYEKAHGPLYYQYDSRLWLGGEGMLYQVGEVQQPLTPQGLISLNGELWKAISMSGESIGEGERVEVISRDGLTLRVDRVSTRDDNPA